MKCLDEGVDIPSAKTAIFCASTGNPKQFIQRRGRVLRKYGNSVANIFDMFVLPSPGYTNGNINDNIYLKTMIERESSRIADFLALSNNKYDLLEDIHDKLLQYGFEEFKNQVRDFGEII
jgi:ERCC4-related helicase